MPTTPKTDPPSRAEKMGLRAQEVRAREKGRTRRAEILQWFAETGKTETAFYLRFQELALGDKAYMQSYHTLPDADWSVFKEITRYWNVKTA